MFSAQRVPNIYFLCAGSGVGETALTAFDHALLTSGVGNTNLVRMSSILPPHCEVVEPFMIPQGSLLPIAYATITSNHVGVTISSAVAIAIPHDRSIAGVIMEHSAEKPLVEVEAAVRDMTREAMAIRHIVDYTIESRGVEAMVSNYTSTFSGVVLWWS